MIGHPWWSKRPSGSVRASKAVAPDIDTLDVGL